MKFQEQTKRILQEKKIVFLVSLISKNVESDELKQLEDEGTSVMLN